MVELLGGEMGGVIGFDQVSALLPQLDERSPGGVAGGVAMRKAPLMEGRDDSSQYQVVMKQLGKRDTTTKLKVRKL